MAYIHKAMRTPVGAFQGALREKTAVQLGAAVVGAVIKDIQQPIDQVIMGNVLQANNGQAPARQVALCASTIGGNKNQNQNNNKLQSAVCTTVNKVCSSGMKAVIMGVQAIGCKDARVVVAGGMESMSTAPFYLPSGRLRLGLYGGGPAMVDCILRDGLLDPLSGKHMGEIAEMTAVEMGITRAEQDEYARLSYQLAKRAWDAGVYGEEIVPIAVGALGDTVISTDEEYGKINYEKISQLKPAFVKGGTITAANASKLNDGASAVLLTDEPEGALAEIIGYAEAEVEPNHFTIAPARAIPLALARAFPEDSGAVEESLKRVSRMEVNEAFAVVSLANHRLLNLHKHPQITYNGHGGAVSLGHPIGSSGCRIVVSLVHALTRGQIGVAAICNGGGGASAIVVRRL